MEITSITLRVIKSPLKKTFVTHLETVKEREVIVVEVRDVEGRVGYGEAVPFSSPWYTEETIKTCFHIIKDFLVPITLYKTWQHPSELPEMWNVVRRNHMAKAGLEQAIWDLYAKQQDVYLGKLFGGNRTDVAAGVVIATNTEGEAVKQIEKYEEEGYQRYKVKIHPENDLSLLSAIRERFPDIQLMADGNSAYTLEDRDHLKKLDAFKLQMIEQPLAPNDIVEHAFLQKELETPICLDESINSFQDAKCSILLKSCGILNIKMSKVGGWLEAVSIHDLCVKNGIPVWCGGMIEFGISRAHNIALATLQGFVIPGDLSSSATFWEEDIIEPEIKVVNGSISVPKRAGIGFTVRKERLRLLTEHQLTIKA